ncbi:MAG: SDR family NAD(P)-dependent oxidoreductase [Phycisphaerales bacterium]|nr:SDR family NAD(P)-dependent oxidoreductase [Phycisphaerales bacterium]
MELEGRIALVTGAAKRIGRTIALELARLGCDVAVHCHASHEDAAATAEKIRQLGRQATVLSADLKDPQATESLAKQTVDALGGLNILINNASIFESMKLEEFSLPKWNETLAVNMTAPMVLSHAAYPHLRARPTGHIVNLLDISAKRPWSSYLSYCASKAGLSNLTLGLAKAMAPEVLVNGVAPGAALSPENYSKDEIKAVTRHIPAMRWGTPENVASAVRFLVTGASYMTGTILNVDGGRSIAW